MTAELARLDDARCLACSGERLTVIDESCVRCDDCGARYDIYEGVPCLVRFQADEVLSLIEVFSSMGMQRRPPSAVAYQNLVDMLARYHAASDREAMLAGLTGGMKRHLPHRHRQYEKLMMLLDGISLAGKRVLDVGAGEGFDSYLLTTLGASVTAVEFNPLQCHLGKVAVPGSRWFCASGHALPFKDDSFDFAVAQAAIHHISDVPAAMSEMLRVVRPGGHILTISDTYRADRHGEERVVKRFDKEPAVLRGVNEGMPRFSDFFSSLLPHVDRVKVDILTGRVVGFPNRETRKRENYMSPTYWKWPEDAEGLSDSNGGMSVKIHKLSATPIEPRRLPQEVVRPLEVLCDLGSKEAAMAKLAAKVPPDYVNAPFPGPVGNQKFQLLNGWQARREDEDFRRSYRRARWFLRRDDPRCSKLALIVAALEGAEPRNLNVTVDGTLVFSVPVKAESWQDIEVCLEQVSLGRSFSVELWLDAEERPFEKAVFIVKRIAITDGEHG